MLAVGASGTLVAVSSSGEGVAGPRPKQRLEDLILAAFGDSGGLTSVEIAAAVEKVSDAKRESVLSTVSRMASKKLLRREGKLYFLVQKGDSPEVGCLVQLRPGKDNPRHGARLTRKETTTYEASNLPAGGYRWRCTHRHFPAHQNTVMLPTPSC